MLWVGVSVDCWLVWAWSVDVWVQSVGWCVHGVLAGVCMECLRMYGVLVWAQGVLVGVGMECWRMGTDGWSVWVWSVLVWVWSVGRWGWSVGWSERVGVGE